MRGFIILLVAVGLCARQVFATGDARPKHIVFLLADDLGWDDVSFHGNQQIQTPTLDSLASQGVILDQNYVQPVCSPTRATIMTGRHVIHTGIYDPGSNRVELSLNFTLLPQHLSRLGYSCHMVGKWHLGYSSWRFVPQSRGFDSYFGYLHASEDYYVHAGSTTNALNFWQNDEPAFQYTCLDGNYCPNDTYSTNIFASKAEEIIKEMSVSDKPMFLYLAWQGVHAPYQAPQDVIDSLNGTISDEVRRAYGGMVKMLDEGIANVTSALEKYGMLNDTLIVFSSDNGAPVDSHDDMMGSNWPLRGTKQGLFQGGVRVPGFVTGAGIQSNRRGTTTHAKVHASDWLPTLLTMAARSTGQGTSWRDVTSLGENEPEYMLGDGIDQWDYLRGATDTEPRDEVLLEAHAQHNGQGNGNSLIVGDWKILLRSGRGWPNVDDGWYGGAQSSDPDLDGYALPIGADTQPYTVQCPPPPGDFVTGYACEEVAPGMKADSIEHACLFNLAEDPCEQQDLSRVYPTKLAALWERLKAYRNTSIDYVSSTTHNPDGLYCPHAVEYPDCPAPSDQAPMSCRATTPCDNPPPDQT